MRKALKWIGIGLGGLVGLLVVVVIGLAVYGQMSFHKKVDRAVYPITADTSPEGVARGEYLVRDVVGCQGCHGPKVEEGQEVARDAPLAGHAEDITFGPIQAGFNTPNLTPDEETGLGNWSDAEIARAIREGIDRDGTVLAIMPSQEFRNLSDSDTAAIIGYLRSLEPLGNEVPEVTANLVGKVVLALNIFGPSNPAPEVTAPVPHPAPGVETGKYLSVMCARCHGEDLAGGPLPGAAPEDLPAANLTPAGELAGWSEADFLTAMTTGRTPSGATLDDSMPWKEFSRWQEEDLAAVFAYLKTLPRMEARK